jgi:phosphatidylserine decarboxylase
MLRFLTSNLLWTEGRAYLIALAGVSVFSFFFFKPLLYPCILLFLFLFYFFRFPKREPEQGANERSIISPADGKVVSIIYDPQSRLPGGYAYRVSIFLSPFDVHVNWIPVSGIVEEVMYQPGKFMMAFLPKSSELNERNDIVLKTAYGTIMVRQIAGTIARRICCWVKKGDSLKQGDAFGMIKFSSRVDLFLPASCSVKLNVGDRVSGGKTILGRF